MSSAPDPLAALESQRSPLELALEVLNRIRRRWWLVVIMVVAIPTYIGWRALQQPVFYSSTMALLLDARPPRVVDKVTEVVADEILADTERFAAGQMRLLTSELMSDSVEQKLGLPKGELAGRLQASIDPKSHVITLEVDDLDAKKAERYVKAFADAYIQATIADRAGVADNATKFLDGEAEDLRKHLEGDEKALYDYNKSNELLASSFDESHKIASSNLAAYHAQLANARAHGIKLKAELESIRDARAKNDPLLLRMLTLPSAGETWSGPQQRYAALIEQLHQLETKYGPNHPKVIETREAMSTVGDMLDKDVQSSISAVEVRARQNEFEQKQLAAVIAEETHKAMALRQKELDYNRLKRVADEDRDAYMLVSKRSRETGLQALVKDSQVKRLEGPTPAGTVDRHVLRSVGFAALAGFVLGLMLALFLDLLDDSIKTPAEAEAELSHPLLGIMMQIPLATMRADDGGPPRDLEIARAEHIVRNPRSLVAEQCQSFTTQIMSLFMEKPPRALMVVSAAVEDGKTLVAMHLASTVAARGKRVLIIDADLRRGRLHRMFQLGRGGGMYELVTQKITLDEACRRTWIPNVDVVTTGEVPLKLSPLRVFEHPELGRVLGQLKDRYDLVVIDTPPIPLVSDALLLAEHVDGAIAVARAKKTSRALTRRLTDQLVGARVNLVGWLLNDLTAAELKSKYYYRYGYGRGYAYKYSDEEVA
jgi:capsular exopolysaccharide synthesis family protein